MDKIGNVEVERPSAPDLILDLLMADGGSLPAEMLCRAGMLMGIGEAAVRVGLTRLVRSGKVVREGRGSYALHRSGPALLRAVDDWRSRHEQTVPWAGDWLAVHDSTVLHSDKTVWRRHSLAFGLRGFAELQPALRLRPDNLAGGLAAERERLAALGLAPAALVFRLAGLDRERQRAAGALWDTAALARTYERLGAALERSRARLQLQGLEAACRESLLLGRAVIGHLLRDPLLPPALMSSDARSTLVAAMGRYQDEALLLWRRWYPLSGPH